MPREHSEGFTDWWDSITFVDEEGNEYSSEDYDYPERVWAIEYAYEHDWDEQEILDMMYEDSLDFWEWFRENY